jgi:hypothetical protein
MPVASVPKLDNEALRAMEGPEDRQILAGGERGLQPRWIEQPVTSPVG